MIFKVSAKSLSVYDPKSETFIATFQDGCFETSDQSVIERMIELGYGEPRPVEQVEAEIAVQSEILQSEKPKRGRPKVIK